MAATPAEIHAAAARLRCALDAGNRPATSRAIAVGEVRRAALAAASDDTDAAIAEALRRMVREALHVLGPDGLRGVRKATLAGRQGRWLRELSYEAMQDGDLARAIAASAIASAGYGALYHAMTVGAGNDFSWHDDPDTLIRVQRCTGHAVFCCPRCPDPPDDPIRRE